MITWNQWNSRSLKMAAASASLLTRQRALKRDYKLFSRQKVRISCKNVNTPCARGHVFVLVALASHEKIVLRHFNGASATRFWDFSLNKILITFRNVRALRGTNSHLSRATTCRAILVSVRLLINRTLQCRPRFVVLWKNEVKNQNSASYAAHKNLSGNS